MRARTQTVLLWLRLVGVCACAPAEEAEHRQAIRRTDRPVQHSLRLRAPRCFQHSGTARADWAGCVLEQQACRCRTPLHLSTPLHTCRHLSTPPYTALCRCAYDVGEKWITLNRGDLFELSHLFAAPSFILVAVVQLSEVTVLDDVDDDTVWDVLGKRASHREKPLQQLKKLLTGVEPVFVVWAPPDNDHLGEPALRLMASHYLNHCSRPCLDDIPPLLSVPPPPPPPTAVCRRHGGGEEERGLRP